MNEYKSVQVMAVRFVVAIVIIVIYAKYREYCTFRMTNEINVLYERDDDAYVLVYLNAIILTKLANDNESK